MHEQTWASYSAVCTNLVVFTNSSNQKQVQQGVSFKIESGKIIIMMTNIVIGIQS